MSRITFITKMSHLCFMIWVMLTFFLLLSPESLQSQVLTYEEVLDLLGSEDWEEREIGVYRLIELQAIDSAQKVEILINSLRNEIESPSSTEMAVGTYMTINEYLKNQYCLAIKKFGAVAKDAITRRLDSALGELKSRLTILLGFLGEETYHDDIRHIYYTSEDGYLRLFAIRALMSFKDTSDVSVFKDALEDDFQTTNYSDIVGRDKGIYIIRMDAAGALGMMGFELKPDGSSYKITAEPEQ